MTEDHDLLIEIHTIVKMGQENFLKHCEDDSAIQSRLNGSLSALHRRIDWLMVAGVLAIVVVVLSWLVKLNGGA